MPLENDTQITINNYLVSGASVEAGYLITTTSSSVVSPTIISVSSSVITSASHEALRQLIHFIDNGPTSNEYSSYYKQTTGGTEVFPTTASWYYDSSLTKKIVEQNVTWSGCVITQSIWRIYDYNGVSVAATATDTFKYSNNIFEVEVTRSIG